MRHPLLRPRWLAGHVLVLVAVLVMVSLGLWQLRRLDERKVDNARILDRSEAAALDGAELVALDGGDGAASAFRRAELTGTFDTEHELLVRFRSLQGLPGYEVVTPLVLSDGSGTVLVDRGWVPLEMGERWPAEEAAPPTGEVQVTGLVRESERRELHSEPVGRGAEAIAAIHVEELAPRLAGDVAPVWLQVTGTPGDSLPAPLPPPDLTEGPHLSYAVQWFSFATIFGVGWVLLCVRRGRSALPGHAPSEPGGQQRPTEAPPEPVPAP